MAHAHALDAMIAVSTVHLSRSSSKLLQTWDENSAPIPGFAAHMFGWYMWCGMENIAEYTVGVPDDLRKILVWAKEQGAAYLSLDSDATWFDAELDTYEEDYA